MWGFDGDDERGMGVGTGIWLFLEGFGYLVMLGLENGDENVEDEPSL